MGQYGSWIPPFPQQVYFNFHYFFVFRLDDSEIKETEMVKAVETVSGDRGNFKFDPGTLVGVH